MTHLNDRNLAIQNAQKERERAASTGKSKDITLFMEPIFTMQTSMPVILGICFLDTLSALKHSLSSSTSSSSSPLLLSLLNSLLIFFLVTSPTLPSCILIHLYRPPLLLAATVPNPTAAATGPLTGISSAVSDISTASSRASLSPAVSSSTSRPQSPQLPTVLPSSIQAAPAPAVLPRATSPAPARAPSPAPVPAPAPVVAPVPTPVPASQSQPPVTVNNTAVSPPLLPTATAVLHTGAAAGETVKESAHQVPTTINSPSLIESVSQPSKS